MSQNTHDSQSQTNQEQQYQEQQANKKKLRLSQPFDTQLQVTQPYRPPPDYSWNQSPNFSTYQPYPPDAAYQQYTSTMPQQYPSNFIPGYQSQMYPRHYPNYLPRSEQGIATAGTFQTVPLPAPPHAAAQQAPPILTQSTPAQGKEKKKLNKNVKPFEDPASAQQKLEKETADKERLEKEKLLEKEREKEKAEKEKAEQEKAEKERLENERLAKEKEEQEKARIQREMEERKPRSYTHDQLLKFCNEISNFVNPYFQTELWVTLTKRKFSSVKDTKKQQVNNYQNNTKPKPEPVKQTSNTVLKRDPDQKPTAPFTVLVSRHHEDISTKLKKEEIKNGVNWIVVQEMQNNDETVKFQKEIKYRLNQLAPDNFVVVSNAIIDLYAQNPQQAGYIAQQIIEKSQLEPKYRLCYTNLCSKLNARKLTDGEGQEQRKNPTFRKALLDGVQNMFDARSVTEEGGAGMTSEEKDQFHIKRKQKVMGNVRFMGDLYQNSLVPQQAISYAIQELLVDFLTRYQPDQENNDENIEGLIELLDQIGPNYKVKLDKDELEKVEIAGFFDGKSKTKDAGERFFTRLLDKQTEADQKQQDSKDAKKKKDKGLALEQIFFILECIRNKYKLTNRLLLLLENLLDRKRQGWKEILHQKGEQAKSHRQLQQEFEQEIEKQQTSSKQSSRRSTHQTQQQQVVYVEKQKQGRQEQSSQPQTQKIDFDINELKMYTQGTFKLEMQQQYDKLGAEIVKFANYEEPQNIIFEEFFKSFFKATSLNIQRAQFLYTLLSKKETCSSSAKRAIQKVLFDDEAFYDLKESPNGLPLFLGMMIPFVNEEDLDALCILDFKPGKEIEGFTEFLGEVLSQIETSCDQKDIKDFLGKYIRSIGMNDIMTIL